MNDYPKIGVWPDGYYSTANEFSSSGNFRGAIAVAFERHKMVAGDPTAKAVKFGPLACGTECFFSLQPAHLEGPAPAVGTPNTYIMAFDAQTWGSGGNPDGYRLWEFSADWATSIFSFTALGQVDTAPFDAELCNFSRNCIPQPHPVRGWTRSASSRCIGLSSGSFPGHQSIVLNHTVDVGGNLAGIRWAELRYDGSGWAVHQSGTFAPDDGKHRWMGSIAMDEAGNIALGYSVSSSSTYPSIGYVTRSAGDPLGTLPGARWT